MERDRDSIPQNPRRLRLDTRAGLIAGVCAGVARWLDTDVSFVRVAVLVSAIFLPKLVLATYLLAWFALDRAEDGRDFRRNSYARASLHR
jgi:phage shock protein PspC (stress-responsive transcriptional regulator)